MAGLGEHSLEIPDGFLRFREMIGQKAPTILLGEKAVEPPHALFLGADIQNINNQQIPGLTQTAIGISGCQRL